MTLPARVLVFTYSQVLFCEDTCGMRLSHAGVATLSPLENTRRVYNSPGTGDQENRCQFAASASRAGSTLATLTNGGSAVAG